ncbi:hypothetical protein GGR50DRAFT_240828 [Xylaria sp. CBS 124048]|nr:hypothetical protein GGR50DRAFT_240828 [Xylaria sp. CBS 124048]
MCSLRLGRYLGIGQNNLKVSIPELYRKPRDVMLSVCSGYLSPKALCRIYRMVRLLSGLYIHFNAVLSADQFVLLSPLSVFLSVCVCVSLSLSLCVFSLKNKNRQ